MSSGCATGQEGGVLFARGYGMHGAGLRFRWLYVE